MAPSIWQLLIVLVIVLILFGGRGKISQIMGDIGKGITSFRAGMKNDKDAEEEPKEIGSDSTVNPKTSAEATASEKTDTVKS